MKTDGRVRFGLIGPGEFAGQFLAPALAAAPAACLWGVLGRDARRTFEFARQHGAEAPQPAHVSMEEFFSDPGLDAVWISTPDHAHASYLSAALDRGKPVFVEKPMCATSAEGWAIVDLARRSQLVVGVGYHLRHHAGLHQMIARVRDGAIGTPLHMRAQWTYCSPVGPAHRRAKSNTVTTSSLGSFGTHCLDLVRWAMVPMCGEVLNVRSLISNAIWRSANDETAVAVLQLASGATAELISSVLFDSETRIEIFGERGSAVAVNALGAGRNGRAAVNGVELAFDGSDPYAAEAQHFAECVSLRRTPVVDAVEGLRNVQLLERIIAAGRIDQVDAKA